MGLLFGFCIFSILIIGLYGGLYQLLEGKFGTSIMFLFLLFFVGIPLIFIGHDYSDSNIARQAYCTKYYNNNVNKYKVCMNTRLDDVILKGLPKPLEK